MEIATRVPAPIQEFEPYQPLDLEAVAARAGLKVEQLIRLNANENPFGPSPRVAQALAAANWAYYPDYRRLRQAIAGHAGVAAEQVVLGNGSSEAIDLAMRLLLEPGEGVAVCPPTFDMYRFFACLGHYPVSAVPRRDDFSLDVAAIEALARSGDGERPRLLFLASPGNPDGQAIPLDVVERLLRLPLVVVVDEAYVEFGRPAAGRSPERSAGTAGEPTVLPLLARHENLVILRTFSKWAGLAGLRLGYALLAAELAGYLDRIRAPYNVNAAAVIAALATFEDLETVQGNVARLVAEREGLQGALAEIPWLDPLPSQANFILCRVRGQSGAELARALAGRGILVRSFSEPGLEACVRISVGRPEQNGVLLEALRSLILL